MKHAKTITALILALLLIFTLCACGDGEETGGDTKGGKKTQSTKGGAENVSSLVEYARSLEKAGNYEAAAAIYQLIAEGGGADLIKKAHEDIPIIGIYDEMEDLEEIAGRVNGK